MTESDPSVLASAALDAATDARTSMAQAVDYPPGYLPSSAVQAALLMLGASSLATELPAAWLRVPLVLAGVAALVLAVWNLQRFERHNGARIHGLRYARRPTGIYVGTLGFLAIVVSNRANVTSAWWAGLVAAPIASAVTVVYLRAWLAAYRRDQA